VHERAGRTMRRGGGRQAGGRRGRKEQGGRVETEGGGTRRGRRKREREREREDPVGGGAHLLLPYLGADRPRTLLFARLLS